MAAPGCRQPEQSGRDTDRPQLAGGEGVVRELLPAEDGEPVSTIYLVPFHHAEQSLRFSAVACASARLPARSTCVNLAVSRQHVRWRQIRVATVPGRGRSGRCR